MRAYTAPEAIPFDETGVSVFLAGSIEQGKAEDWQQQVIDALADLDGVVYNPRRKEWDASLEQSIDNPQFAEQVNWEIDHIDRADIVFMYLQPGTKSPISLLELGYVLGNPEGMTNLIVVCPDGFWRKGNVEIMIARESEHRIAALVNTLEDGIKILRDRIEALSQTV